MVTNAANDANYDSKNSDDITVKDAMEATVASSVAAVAFLVVEYCFMIIIEKWKNWRSGEDLQVDQHTGTL